VSSLQSRIHPTDPAERGAVGVGDLGEPVSSNEVARVDVEEVVLELSPRWHK
jgi:hypothetical protein